MTNGIIAGAAILFIGIWYVSRRTPFYWGARIGDWFDAATVTAALTIPVAWRWWRVTLAMRREEMVLEDGRR